MRNSPETEPETRPSRDEAAPPPGAEGDGASAEELRDQLEQARAQLAGAEDRYLRARADLENYRKRADRELQQRLNEWSDRLLRTWLEVVDSFERALVLAEDDPQLAEGLRAVQEQIDGLLARQGVLRFGEVGEPFDPELHEAIAVMPSGDRPAGTIAEIARSGYSVGDRLLRPAQVAVAGTPDDRD
jgi:molecular chaperone GrpE